MATFHVLEWVTVDDELIGYWVKNMDTKTLRLRSRNNVIGLIVAEDVNGELKNAVFAIIPDKNPVRLHASLRSQRDNRRDNNLDMLPERKVRV